MLLLPFVKSKLQLHQEMEKISDILCSNFRTHTNCNGNKSPMTYHDHVQKNTQLPHLLLLQILAVPQGLSEKKGVLHPNIKAEHGQNGTYNKQK